MAEPRAVRMHGAVHASSIAVSVLVFSVLASVVYFLIITNATLSFAGPETLDQAYRALAQAMLEGRLDITRAVIGNEGFYVDGKVYLYYGVLPALIRMPFLLIGEAWLPGPRFFVLCQAILTAALLHLTLMHLLASRVAQATRATALAAVVFTGLIAWFASPAYLLTTNASIYHEPFGCALLLFAAVLYVLRHAILQALTGALPTISATRLMLVGLLSALALHARPPMALSLFALIGLLCLWTIAEPRAGTSLPGRVGHMMRKGIVPGMLLAASIAAFLLLNWLRFGDWFDAGPKDRYGYFLFVEGHSARMDAFFEHGRFDLLRMVPNLIVHLTGLPWFHAWLTQTLDVGRIRLEGPLTGIAVLWLLPVVYAVIGAVTLARRLRGKDRAGLWLLSLVVAMAFSTVMMLSYATVTMRYKFEIWPLIFTLALIGLHAARNATFGSWTLDPQRTQSGAVPMAGPVVWLALAVSLTASSFAVFALKSDPFFNGEPYSVFLNRLNPDLGG